MQFLCTSPVYDRTDGIHVCVLMQDRTRGRKGEERGCLLLLGVPAILCNSARTDQHFRLELECSVQQ